MSIVSSRTSILNLLAALLLTAQHLGAAEVELIGLTNDNRIVRFSSGRPSSSKLVSIIGASDNLLGIDHRPADGKLYAISNASDLYAIDPTDGAAKLVSTLTVAFDAGLRSGVDFNPQVDRLRLVGANGQNLRAHADIGAVATDGALVFARGDRHFGKKPALTAAAYTNSIAAAPTTKLFDIDADLDVLVLQEPPNDGTLMTVGGLGVDFGPFAGFEIVTDASGKDHAFAVNGSTLYSIDLATGAATSLGVVADGTLALVGLAFSGSAAGAAE